MKRPSWQVMLGLTLIALAGALYLIHFLLFRDAHHIFIFLLADVAFLPIEVLLVTIIIHRLLSEREKKARLEKLNMVIGAFFTKMGTEVLAHISKSDPRLDEMRQELAAAGSWSGRELTAVDKRIGKHQYSVDIQKVNLAQLKELLMANFDFLLRLLENPNLFDHESFTDLLWSVFHLGDELARREDLQQLPAADLAHLAYDTERVYSALSRQWFAYMKHMRAQYPYLFHLAIRTNPFDQNASVTVQ